jgi:hypothetical protein
MSGIIAIIRSIFQDEGSKSPAMKSPRQHLPAGMPGGDSDGTPSGTSSKPHARFVADGLFERFKHIEAVLARVIGRGGVVALYERSRHLSGRPHLWLAPLNEGKRNGMDLEELRTLVAQQTDEAAAAGAGLLLKTFHDLLAGLVGVSLTSQLLGAPPSLGLSRDETA